MTTIGMGERPAGPATGRGAGRGTGRRFYTAMAIVIAVYVLYGFGRSYIAALAPPGMPFWVHLHGAVFTTWIALFVTQTWLVGRRSLALHRTLGWAACGLVAAMVVLGIATTVLCVKRGAVPSFFTPGLMLALDLLGLLGFVGLFAAAVALRRDADWHKRLMLCATILLSSPAWGRILPMGTLGKAAPIALVAALVVVAGFGVAYDVVTRRRPHPAYAWGIAAIVLSILAAGPIAFSAPMDALVRAIKA